MSAKKKPLKEFQLNLKITAYYDVTAKAETFQEAIEKAKNINGYELLTTKVPFDSDVPQLWSVTDLSA